MSAYPVDAVSGEPPRSAVERSPAASPPPAHDRPREFPQRAAWPARGRAWLARFAFRFGVLYLAIFLLGRTIGMVPGISTWLNGPYHRMWRSFVPWVGKHVLRLDHPVSLQMSGSGDKLFDWVQVATMAMLAALGALAWVWFDRRRKWDRVSGELTRIALRYSLGATMMSYGVAKILREQMPAPGLYRLLETYGESSPMGMLWAFMGQSWAYSAFAGGMEFLGGILLFFRRTTGLGALLLITVMTNVVLMNFCFDVPVKLYSSHYLLFAVIIAWPDLRRITNLLLFHRPTAPAPIMRPWPVGRSGRLVSVVKGLLIVWLLWSIPTQRVWRWIERPAPAKNALFGLYEVETFSLDGTERPPLLTDTVRWRRMGLEETRFGLNLVVTMMDDKRRMYRVRIPPHAGLLEVQIGGPQGPWNVFKYTQPNQNTLSIEGQLGGQDIVVRLRRADESKLLLVNRGFHWISETPFNR